MGLDITHYKAVLKLPENPGLINVGGEIRGQVGAETKESFSDFNVSFEHFQNYIQLIDCPKVIDTLIIVDEKEDLETTTNHFSKSDYKIFLNDKELKRELKIYESERKLENCEKYFSNSALNKWKILNYFETEKKEGFYYQAVGDQRKGMNDMFWNRFCNNNIYNYARKEDFEFAMKCLRIKQPHEYKSEFELRKEKFKDEFINNFELGASFMFVSY
ncbi:hypothetical protein MG296_14570 [Flavobacteriaceae bacterium TK19130]|nr:hypothetical protein [Thermobacterium salinum]